MRRSDSGGYLYSIGVASGSIQWSLHLPDSRGLASAITVSPSGTVLVGGSLGHMFAVHADGTFGWSCATQGAVIGAPVLNREGSAVYFASTDTYVGVEGRAGDGARGVRLTQVSLPQLRVCSWAGRGQQLQGCQRGVPGRPSYQCHRVQPVECEAQPRPHSAWYGP